MKLSQDQLKEVIRASRIAYLMGEYLTFEEALADKVQDEFCKINSYMDLRCVAFNSFSEEK